MTHTRKVHVTLIGCGKMGSALIQGWIAADFINRLDIIDPNDIPESLPTHDYVSHTQNITDTDMRKTDIVVLCVKPQIMDNICQDLAEQLKQQQAQHIPILSIAAGKTIQYFETELGHHTPIIRTMPNLPATIGKGITALCANKHATDTHKDIAQNLMTAAGDTLWIDDESQMDTVTALSGSGPAYVFYLVEALAHAGQQLGLNAEQATQLARQTVIGAGALLEDAKDIEASTLRQNVTSKGGTTQAALEVLMDGTLQDILTQTLKAAEQRGKDLAD